MWERPASPQRRVNRSCSGAGIHSGGLGEPLPQPLEERPVRVQATEGGRVHCPAGSHLLAMMKGSGCHRRKEVEPSLSVFHFKQGIQEFSPSLMENWTVQQNSACKKERARRLSSRGPVHPQLPFFPNKANTVKDDKLGQIMSFLSKVQHLFLLVACEL